MAVVSGKTVTPGAAAVICDTGALSAGEYDFYFAMSESDTAAAGKGLIVEHRNAANSATLQTLGGCPAGDSSAFSLQGYGVGDQERIRVVQGGVAGAASSEAAASIYYR
jgi:hypothetical protein